MSSQEPPVVRVGEIAQHEGQVVELRGWVYNLRSSGKLHFVQVRDGSGIIQCVVFKGDVEPEVFECAAELTQEASVIVQGEVRADARSPLGFELGVQKIDVVNGSVDFPISPKEHGTAFLMEHRHLWLRSSRPNAVLRIRGTIVDACRQFMSQEGFLLIDAPVLTPAACEGTTTLFETDYFGQTAYLTQSGQLYMEAAAMAFGKVYCFGPTFRAEKSKTRRHLTEFWMIEPEMAFCDLAQDMEIAQGMVAHVVGRVLADCSAELALLERDRAPLERVVAGKPFPRLQYDDAIEILKSKGSQIEWGSDLGGEDETLLSQDFDTPVLVHRYPAAVKAFYMKQDPEDDRLALCVDMLAPEGYGEIIGGGQREDDLGKLEGRIAAHGLPREAFEWYLDLRKYGSVPHAGFGMGIERVVGWLCGVPHVRETIPFPRTLQRIYP
ncbi:MAG TPA: asparagine--tRNA ligase [Candidatus Latescibacteria bacterium]|jgi:asparaginyl-tRNA synthetase|nr:asparagine--tRNA ligase [Candidatus Latescibacterota bacterium]